MGFGDFVKGVVSAAVPDPIEHAVAAGLRKFGEETLEHANQSAGRQRQQARNPAANVGANAVLNQPAVRTATEVATSPIMAPYRETGQYLETTTRNKIEAAQGYYRAGKYVLTHDPRTTARKVGEGVQTFASAVKEDPSILGSIALEAGVATALDPMTYMGGGFVGGAAAVERSVARSATRTIAREATEAAARSADDVAGDLVRTTARAAREAAPEGLDEALAAGSQAGRTSTRRGRFLEAIDTGPANLRESITDKPVGRVGQARMDWAERRMPGAQETIPRAIAKDVLSGSPTLPTQGAGLGYRQAVWRAQQVGRRVSLPGRVRTAERIGLALHDPSRVLHDPQVQGWAMQSAEWAVREHPEAVAAAGGLMAAGAAGGALSTAMGLRGAFEGGDEGEAAPERSEPYEPYTQQPTTVQDIGLMQFRLDNTRSTAVSRRRPGGAARLGTVTRDSTMPTQIGPSNWYGPQGGYSAGRGFQQRRSSWGSQQVLGV